MVVSILLNLLLMTAEQDLTAISPDQEQVRVVGIRERLSGKPYISRSLLGEAEIGLVEPTHPNELFSRLPGSWISRGSGQESLIAVRSPVLTGAGACGAFLVLEDQVPIRPTGFCNVNQLFEVNLNQASRIELTRGPGTQIEGSNALHGVIAVSGPIRSPVPSTSVRLTGGSDEYRQAALSHSSPRAAVNLRLVDADSFRQDEQFRHGLANGVWWSNREHLQIRTSFAAANLDQDTAGFILGKDAYKDPYLRTQNLNPEAYRRAAALRLVSQWTWDMDSGGLQWIPYARYSDMEFLQHFLPGKPLEKNGQRSIGARLSWSDDSAWSAGLDAEWARGDLSQYQAQSIEDGSEFLRETRPQGYHYDYEVTARSVGAWLSWEYLFNDFISLNIGLRADYLHYDYRNFLPDGNSKDDGSACGFGGCLYTRPADRKDAFSDLAPNLGLFWRISPEWSLGVRLAQGFRFPQATELYRLQRGQQVSDLSPTEMSSFEVTVSMTSEKWRWDLAAFYMQKRHFIFREANGYNVSDGRTDHLGAELSLNWALRDDLGVGINLGYGRHQYDFDRLASAGERIRRGNQVDTAPEWLGSVRLDWRPAPQSALELEWVAISDYFLDAANQHRYTGHRLLNLRARQQLTRTHSLAARFTNLTDHRYAERADFAFGNYRYFPGAERRLYIEWEYRH